MDYRKSDESKFRTKDIENSYKSMKYDRMQKKKNPDAREWFDRKPYSISKSQKENIDV